MASAARQFGQTRDKTTHKLRSAGVKRGRGTDRFKTLSWWRRATFSSSSATRERKADRKTDESWQDRHRKSVAARRVNSIISSCSEFPVGTGFLVHRVARHLGHPL